MSTIFKLFPYRIAPSVEGRPARFRWVFPPLPLLWKLQSSSANSVTVANYFSSAQHGYVQLIPEQCTRGTDTNTRSSLFLPFLLLSSVILKNVDRFTFGVSNRSRKREEKGIRVHRWSTFNVFITFFESARSVVTLIRRHTTLNDDVRIRTSRHEYGRAWPNEIEQRMLRRRVNETIRKIPKTVVAAVWGSTEIEGHRPSYTDRCVLSERLRRH